MLIASHIYYHFAAQVQERQSVDWSDKDGNSRDHQGNNLRQVSRLSGSFSRGPDLIVAPPPLFFVSRSARGWHSSSSPDSPTYHGFLSARSSSVCSPKAKSSSPRVTRRSRSLLILSGISFSRFSCRREAFPLSSII